MPRKKAADQKRKAYQRYAGYWTIRGGKLYAVANIPLGNGTYKKKLKRVETKTEAMQWAVSEIGKGRNGEAIFESSHKRKNLFAEFAEWYKVEYLIAPVYQNGKRVSGLRTYKQQQAMADRLIKTLGTYDLKKITVDVLRRYKRKRLETVSIATVNREFALLHTMLKKALRRKLIDENPFAYEDEHLIETDLEDPRKSPLTRRIAVRLLARSRKSEQPLMFPLIMLLMNTGARPSEAFPYAGHDENVIREPIIWKNILDFDFRVVKLVSYKGKVRKERFVPTTIGLETCLRELYIKVDPSLNDLIFPVTTVKRSWATLCRSVRVTGIRIRDFRHYYNSRLVQNPNINDMERLLLMGQVRMSTNARYSHLDDSFVQKYRDVIDAGEMVN